MNRERMFVCSERSGTYVREYRFKQCSGVNVCSGPSVIQVNFCVLSGCKSLSNRVTCYVPTFSGKRWCYFPTFLGLILWHVRDMNVCSYVRDMHVRRNTCSNPCSYARRHFVSKVVCSETLFGNVVNVCSEPCSMLENICSGERMFGAFSYVRSMFVCSFLVMNCRSICSECSWERMFATKIEYF